MPLTDALSPLMVAAAREGAALALAEAGAAARSAEWLAPELSPLGKRQTLALARSGALESAKVGRKVLVRKTSLDAYLREHERGIEASQDEDLFGAKGAA